MSKRCIEKYCTNRHAPKRRRCYRCSKARHSAANPMRQCYHNLKGNAKRRGKHFDLTFEQFAEFAVRVDLLAKRGKTKESYTVDRIRDNEGYVVGNLQRLTLSENSRKRKITYNYQTKVGGVMDMSPSIKLETDPF